MKKVIFRDQNGDNLFINTELEKFIIPREGDTLIWMKLVSEVTSITHNYDEKEIIVNIKIQ